MSMCQVAQLMASRSSTILKTAISPTSLAFNDKSHCISQAACVLNRVIIYHVATWQYRRAVWALVKQYGVLMAGSNTTHPSTDTPASHVPSSRELPYNSAPMRVEFDVLTIHATPGLPKADFPSILSPPKAARPRRRLVVMMEQLLGDGDGPSTSFLASSQNLSHPFMDLN